MTNAIRLHVWSDRACFTRPEFKVERVSYEVMTPTAARACWRPSIGRLAFGGSSKPSTC